MPEDLDAIAEEETEEVEVLDETKDTEEESEAEESSPSQETETEEEAKTVPIARLNQVLERERLANEQLASVQAERQRLLDHALAKPETKTGDVDPDDELRAEGYDPDFMTDNDKVSARKVIATERRQREAEEKQAVVTRQTAEVTEKQQRYLAQVETISECEDSPLTGAQKEEILKHSIRISTEQPNKTPEQWATLGHAAWKKSRTKPTDKIKSDKATVAESPNRVAGPTRGSIPAGGNLSLDDAIEAAAKAMGYTGS